MTILVVAIILGRTIEKFGGSLFVYIQSLYAFFAPPFAAVFLLGILFKRINGQGATVAVFLGFIFGIAMKLYVQYCPNHYLWVEPYGMQSMINWIFCVVVCTAVSFMTAAPKPEQVSDSLTINWKKLNIFNDLGDKWYQNVVLWWGLFALIILSIIILLSGKFI